MKKMRNKIDSLEKLLVKYVSHQQRIIRNKKYDGKSEDLRYVLGLIHGVNNSIRILKGEKLNDVSYESQ